jgi:hypothetical protein
MGSARFPAAALERGQAARGLWRPVMRLIWRSTAAIGGPQGRW